MKKAIKVNLGGIIFHIDEDAYEKLNHYLNSVTLQFADKSEAKEIITDIESRIAELLQTKINQLKQVITISDIDEVIGVMGKPSDYNPVADDGFEPHYSSPNKTRAHRRRVYRDVDNSVLGGVCSGLGAYFDIDPVILRILFVLLLFAGGSAVLIYLILWIVFPAARTAAQKLEMRGEDVTIDSIKQEHETVKQKYSGGRFRNFIDRIFRVIGTIVKAVLKIIAVFIGIILVLVGIVLIFGLVFGFSFGNYWAFGDHLHIFHMPFLAGQFLNPVWFWVLIVSLILLTCIPILCIIYLGIKLIFRFEIRNRNIWIGAFGVWIVSLILFIVLLVFGMRDIAEDNNRTSSLQLNIKPYKVLYLKINAVDSLKLKEFIKINGEAKYYISDDQKSIYGRPHLVIERDFNDEAMINIDKSARGATFENAAENSRNINFDIIQNDSLILFDSFFQISKNTNWRAQQVEIKLKLPKGASVYIDKSLASVLIDAETKDDLSLSELLGKTWIMGEEGLKQAQ